MEPRTERMYTEKRLSHLHSMVTAVTLSAIVLVFLLAGPAFGASIPLSIEQMSRDAHAVAVVDCVSTVSRLVDPAAGPRGGIVTDFTFSVSEAVVGAPDTTFTITQQGGEVGGIGLAVSELPDFLRGRRYVVFVGRDGQVVGGLQGAISVSGERIGSSLESLGALKRRVRAAVGRPMTLAETLADTIVARVAEASPAEIKPLATPVISSMTPSNVSAGTGDVVTISGSGFGVTEGSVDFYFRSGYAGIPATVTSWSDTSITCEVPEGAGSGAVTVTNNSGPTSYAYDVGFSFGGAKWGSGVLTETYKINPNCVDATASEVSLVDAAAATWSAASSFKFVSGGTCLSTANPSEFNSSNDIYWASTGFTGSTLAWNRCWFYSGTPYDRIIETDIVFNDFYTWGDGTGGTYDIQAVALHELGHSLNLSDQYGTSETALTPEGVSQTKVMCGTISSNSQRRKLTVDDIAGVRWIYGTTGDIDSTPPTGSFAIAAGASQTATTSVTVNSSVTGATEMSIAANGVTFGTWQAYAAVRSIVLPAGVGMKTVKVSYRDAALNTATFSDTIELTGELVARDFAWTVLAGSDRYATALAVSRSAFANGSCDTVIIATGTNFPDALGAGGLAGAARCPILLVRSTGGLPTAVKTEINRLTQGHATRKVYITGSTTVVSALTESNLKSLVGSTNVKRLGGKDRFATANLIAREVGVVLTAKGIPYSGKAFVTTGLTFPDALLASPVAYAGQRPVLLIGKTGVDSALKATITALGVTDIHIVGSTASVSTSVQTALDGMSGVSVERVAAATDKYAMTVAFADHAASEEGFSFDYVGIATGDNFPDALAAGPALGETRSVMLLTPTKYLDSRVQSSLEDYYESALHVRFLGGLPAVSQPVRDAVCDTLE